MDATLRLQPHLEARFWGSASVQRQLQIADITGIGFNMALNALAISLLHVLPLHFHLLGSMAALQLLLIGWCLFRVESYMRWRVPILLVQRIRWVAMVAHTCYGHTTEEVFLQVHRHLAAFAGSWSAFVVLAFYVPLLALLNAINLIPPFWQAAPLAFATLVVHTQLALPHQMQALQDYDAQRFVQPACEAVERIVLAPFNMLARSQAIGAHFLDAARCSSPAAAEVLFSWLFVVVAVLMPLHSQHYWEYSAKAAFLRATSQPHVASRRHASLTVFIASAWAAVAAVWILFSLLRRDT
jgi:hypothetical protein